jgi:small nuclear ribonucleoprotein (snRNP)-like protein
MEEGKKTKIETTKVIKNKLISLTDSKKLIEGNINLTVTTILDQSGIEYTGKKISFDDNFNIIIE